MNRGAALAATIVLAALAGCERESSDERSGAAGEILPGSVSDAMLETDRLQVEAPLADPEAAEQALEAGEKKAGGKRRTPDGDDAPSPSPTPEATPDAAPSPTPAPPPKAPAG